MEAALVCLGAGRGCGRRHGSYERRRGSGFQLVVPRGAGRDRPGRRAVWGRPGLRSLSPCWCWSEQVTNGCRCAGGLAGSPSLSWMAICHPADGASPLSCFHRPTDKFILWYSNGTCKPLTLADLELLVFGHCPDHKHNGALSYVLSVT